MGRERGRGRRTPTAVRAAVEHAALLAASVVLRERTALEVEMRIRGGFVDDLCARRAARRGAARRRADPRDRPDGGLRASSSSSPCESRDVRADAGLLYDVVAECARGWPGGRARRRRAGAASPSCSRRSRASASRTACGRALAGAARGRVVRDRRRHRVPAVGDYAASESAARHALDLMRPRPRGRRRSRSATRRSRRCCSRPQTRPRSFASSQRYVGAARARRPRPVDRAAAHARDVFRLRPEPRADRAHASTSTSRRSATGSREPARRRASS